MARSFADERTWEECSDLEVGRMIAQADHSYFEDRKLGDRRAIATECPVVDFISDVLPARLGTQYGRYPVPDGLSGDRSGREYGVQVRSIGIGRVFS